MKFTKVKPCQACPLGFDTNGNDHTSYFLVPESDTISQGINELLKIKEFVDIQEVDGHIQGIRKNSLGDLPGSYFRPW